MGDLNREALAREKAGENGDLQHLGTKTWESRHTALRLQDTEVQVCHAVKVVSRSVRSAGRLPKASYIIYVIPGIPEFKSPARQSESLQLMKLEV